MNIHLIVTFFIVLLSQILFDRSDRFIIQTKFFLKPFNISHILFHVFKFSFECQFRMFLFIFIPLLFLVFDTISMFRTALFVRYSKGRYARGKKIAIEISTGLLTTFQNISRISNQLQFHDRPKRKCQIDDNYSLLKLNARRSSTQAIRCSLSHKSSDFYLFAL